jgi:CheY-like chemotaxis protein
VDILPGPAANRGFGLEPGRYVRLTVADNGMGMDEKTVARAFEPFFTTKEHGKGTGLGLAVVHGIVKSHDGAISVESAPGKGTRFDLHFPASTESATTDRGTLPRLQPGQGERILFVDDEEPLVRNARRMLEPRNFHFTGHTDPEAALRDLRSAPEDYDVVVTDIVMPRLGGIELARQIRELRPDLPIIFVTGFSQDLTVDLIKELGVDSVLQKPHTLAELVESIRHALSSAQAARPSPAGP